MQFKIENKGQIPMDRISTYLEGLDYSKPHVVRIEPWTEPRNLDQNALMWAMLTDISNQVEWHGEKMSTNSWKAVFSAAVFNQKTVPGINGELVVIGVSTSKLSKKRMSDLIEIMNVFGIEHNVKWTAPDYYDDEGFVK